MTLTSVLVAGAEMRPIAQPLITLDRRQAMLASTLPGLEVRWLLAA
jgi:hypothetical protein